MFSEKMKRAVKRIRIQIGLISVQKSINFDRMPLLTGREPRDKNCSSAIFFNYQIILPYFQNTIFAKEIA